MRNCPVLLFRLPVRCIILNSISTVSHDNPGMILKILAGVVMYIISIACPGIYKNHAGSGTLRGTYMCMFIFSNNSFYGISGGSGIIRRSSAIFYITIFNMPFNILFFSLALHYFKKDAAIESGTYTREKPDFRKFINNGIIASIAALIIYFANIPMPVF